MTWPANKKDINDALNVLEAIRPSPNFVYTQAEIAAACGLSKVRVCQIEQEALRKIRRHPAITRIREGWRRC